MDTRWLAPALSLVLLTAGCGPRGALKPLLEDDGGGGGPVNFAFQLPEDGYAVDEVTTVSVSGRGLVMAQFNVDGVQVAEDIEAPFEWVLDPGEFVLGRHEVEVIGEHTGGDKDRKSVEVILERAVPLAEISEAMRTLEPDAWYEIPNSRLRAVASDSSITDLMGSSSGGVFDTSRDRLLVWGSGGTFGGNEVYAFDLGMATWTRLRAADRRFTLWTSTPAVGSRSRPPARWIRGRRRPRGVFGRFRYCPSMDLFVVVNSVDTNVFVYRLP